MRSLRCDMNKTIINMGFIGAIIITTILCFTAEVYTDNNTGKVYTVFEAISGLDKQIIKSDFTMASIFIFRNAMSDYLTMFMPIIVAFPFMVSFCAERNSGLMRVTITRTGKYCYYFSKFFACFISGGAAVMIGVAFFGMICFIFFPGLPSYTVDADVLRLFLPDGVMISVIKMLAGAFARGAFSTLPAFFLSSFCKNPYLITCIPFLINYIWVTALSKIMNDGWEQGNFEIYDQLSPYTPESVTRLLYISEFNDVAVKTLSFNLGYLIVMFAGFVIIMNKRIDKGV